jgi:hypothetical protein
MMTDDGLPSLFNTRHFLKASSCLVKAMNGFAAALGKDDDSTIATKKDLARVLQGLGSSAALQGSETKLNIVEVSTNG